MTGKVIRLGEHRISSKKKSPSTCSHMNMVIDHENALVLCEDCGEYLNPVRVLERLAQDIEIRYGRIQWEREELEKLRGNSRHLIAARKAEKAWKSRDTVPICPHCDEAIFPDDGFGERFANKKHAIERRKFQDKK